MWHDVETTKDLLNFGVVAKIAAELVRDSGNQPLSIGVSGSWGTGKSSLVKMIGTALAKEDISKDKYIFLEFNAWLYQGYDDARMALLQSVADKLCAETNKRKTCIDKALDFAKRVKWLQFGKFILPTATGAILGGALGGPLGAMVGAVGGLCKDTTPSPEDLEKVKTAYANLQPELSGLMRDRESRSLPQEINELRFVFADLLASLNVKLVVLVDDLDRCLPSTAISTLEAMRLLLFMPRTAFIIAADEEMIRGAVRMHFGDGNMGENLATSYFDKLIQIPLRVPRLGTTEVKAYLILLFADLMVRRGIITENVRTTAESVILGVVRKSWTGGLTRKKMEEAFGSMSDKLNTEIDLADQLAGLLVSADRIAGNPRLIKRFLNNLLIRDAIAKAEGMSISFDQLVKLQLFERCASPAAFEYLIKQVAESENGRVTFLATIEEQLARGETYVAADSSWEGSFIEDWVKLNPKLGGTDLRPLLHLSRDRTLSLASFDELSPDGRALLDALLVATTLMPPLVAQLKQLGEGESERILNRIHRRARANQWDRAIITQALHVPKAFPSLAPSYVRLLNEMPAAQRPAPLIPRLSSEPWAKDILKRWGEDNNSPIAVRNAINKPGRIS